ncbi:MAG: AMP-dependent synthetase [Hyphomicrobiales bacterium]|nr:AMP-dependent synthetase [Hyphomicrobiales bacterium]
MLGLIVTRNLRLRGQAPAIIFEGAVLTHSEVAGKAFQLIRALRRRGVGPHDRVAIFSQNRPEYLIAFAAGEIGGWTTVPMNFRLSAPEVAHIIGDSQPKAVLIEAQFMNLLPPDLAASSIVIAFDAEGPDGAFDALLATESAAYIEPVRAPDAIAYLIYTSGTTGRPKGVMIGHGAQLAAARISAIEMGVRPTDRVAVAMPLYHIGARNNCLTRSLHGCPVILHRAYRTAEFLSSLKSWKVTETLLAPTMLNDLLDAQPEPSLHLPDLRKIYYSAAPMPEKILRRAINAFGPIFSQVYGMTESGGPGTILQPHQHVLDGPPEQVRRLRSAGQPMVGCEVRILRPDGGECAPGEAGEITMRSDGLMRGYWNNHVATQAALRDGFLHTGDIGEMDEEGFVFVVDRLKDMIVSGGENIYSVEVENALVSHQDVLEAAVIGRPDERWGERVVAFIVSQPGARENEAGLIAHCRSRIAPYKAPKEIIFVNSLPKLPTGKVEKYKLRSAAAREA